MSKWARQSLGAAQARGRPHTPVRGSKRQAAGPPGPLLQSPAPDAPGRGPPMWHDGGGQSTKPAHPGGLGPGPASSTQARTPREHPGGRAPAPATSRQSGPSWPLRHPEGPQAAVPHHQGTSPGLSRPRARGQQQLREQGTVPGGGRRSPATHPDGTWARVCPLGASTHLTGCGAISCPPPWWA